MGKKRRSNEVLGPARTAVVDLVVPPGSYALFARYQRTPQTAPPWPVTYCPGTRDLANAIRIEVGSAAEHDGLDFAIFLDEALPENR